MTKAYCKDCKYLKEYIGSASKYCAIKEWYTIDNYLEYRRDYSFSSPELKNKNNDCGDYQLRRGWWR